jgi:hypothetical protein
VRPALRNVEKDAAPPFTLSISSRRQAVDIARTLHRAIPPGLGSDATFGDPSTIHQGVN